MFILLEEMVCPEPGLVDCDRARPYSVATNEPRREKQHKNNTNLSHSLTKELLQNQLNK